MTSFSLLTNVINLSAIMIYVCFGAKENVKICIVIHVILYRSLHNYDNFFSLPLYCLMTLYQSI